jgi:hypothetical protein
MILNILHTVASNTLKYHLRAVLRNIYIYRDIYICTYLYTHTYISYLRTTTKLSERDEKRPG